ncbi:MAG: polyprenyl synthetase family protein [Nitrososphaerota archaeon]|nr:polyprenyl synthetase family protein [Nitrososphaerota archaeon]
MRTNKNSLDRLILDFLPATDENPEIMGLHEMMRDYPSRGGKGLRGSLCLLCCELFGGDKQDAMIAAAGLELFQNWILIHDDIEDQSDLRRGLPALHKKVGLELAINVGDALHGKMWELLLQNRKRLGSELTIRILDEFAKMLNATTEGQQMELRWTTTGRWNITEADYFMMVTKKSAWYTCISPTRLGILTASNRNSKQTLLDESLMTLIVEYGTHLGISFQIVDDVLNLMGDESKYGKEILGDLFEGKRTLMLIHLLNRCDLSKKRRIIDVLSKPREKKKTDEVRYIFDSMLESGSIDYAKQTAKQLSERALGEFDEIASSHGIVNTPFYSTTRSLVDYLTSRDY